MGLLGFVRKNVQYELGYAVGLIERYVKDSGYVLYDGLGLEGSKRGYLTHSVHPVVVRHVVYDTLASFEAEVYVKVRKRDP